MVAGTARRYGNAVANGETGDTLSQSLDGAGDLMAEDHWLPHAHGAEAAMVVIMQVGAADAARFDGDLDLSRTGLLGLPFLNPQILRRVDDNRWRELRVRAQLLATGLEGELKKLCLKFTFNSIFQAPYQNINTL
ncbi:hypothetical protein SAMN03159288_03654 [Rhizobium sp. NFACC06-2]|nr:hypothetical protein SAMN03159288_03654 [Rhizobium sp. NFACC06-2]